MRILSADVKEENILNIKKPSRKYFRYFEDRSPLVNTTVCLFYKNGQIKETKCSVLIRVKI